MQIFKKWIFLFKKNLPASKYVMNIYFATRFFPPLSPLLIFQIPHLLRELLDLTRLQEHTVPSPLEITRLLAYRLLVLIPLLVDNPFLRRDFLIQLL